MNKILFIATLLACFNCTAFVPGDQFSDVQYNNLTMDSEGFISNTNSDGHLVLNNITLTRSQMCGLSLVLEFKQPLRKAAVFDLYWRTAKTGFSETQKAFFIISPKDAQNKNSYVIDMCKLYNFSGNLNKPLLQGNIVSLRLDYPPNKNLSLRIEDIKLLDTLLIAQDKLAGLSIEPHEVVPRESFTSADVIIPKLIFSFEEGVKRFSKDLPFLIFWLSLIFLLNCLLLSSFVRQFKNDDD
ncbi:hypothetical protein N9060_00645 [Arenicella sp.]|nr:hypothetical protein [Arenicella sp.]